MPTTHSNHSTNQSTVETKPESIFSNLQGASEDCVRDNPITSTMLAMGAGAAIGILIANSMGRREEQRRSSYVSQLATQIANSIGSVVPDSLNWKR